MATQVACYSATAIVGQTISHYRVLRMVGAGGMGDVYEAEDLNLGRHVALKFLSSTHTHSLQAVQRLEREARAASALNHAHICTIYDIGEHDGERFIVMELLDGETLRDRLKRGPLDPQTFLQLAIQVADALDAAHRAHIVHRDLSPSNVFITRNGNAKLLDFGLATHEHGLDDVPLRPNELTTTTVEPVLTSPGAVVGTVAYMSPEQVRGDEVDHRTDEFSLGVVLYEMATGKRPFTGKSSALIFDAILHAMPEPVSGVNAAMPPGLQPIIDKALEKDRHLRYQSAEEIRTDLERLRRDLEAPVPVAPSRPPRGRPWMALGLGGLLAAAGLVHLWPPTSMASLPSPRQVTGGAALERDPVIAPDGKTIAFTSDQSGNDDIWIVDVRGGPTRRVTSDAARDSHASWFPDGRTLVFASDRSGRTDIWRAPTLDGDAATLLVPNAGFPALSPDGNQIAFVRAGPGGYTRLFVAPVADVSQARALSGDLDGRWDHQEPAWSPDGTLLSYSAWDGLWVVPATGGVVRRLTSKEGDGHPAWSPDGRYVYFQSFEDQAGTVWRILAAGGPRQRMTGGSGSELSPDLSRDGRVLAFDSPVGDDELVSIDLETGREIQFGTGRDDVLPTLGPDGGVVYFQSNSWGTSDIWSQRLLNYGPTGPPQRVFEQDDLKAHPACSPDGQWLAYYLRSGTRRDVWIVRTSGGTPVRITTDGNSIHPSWSPDSTAIAYGSERDGAQAIWTRRIVNGHPAGAETRVTGGGGRYFHMPAWSPDASHLAFITSGPSGLEEVGVVASAGGPSKLVTSGADAACARWNRQSGALVVAGRWGRSQFELRSIDLDGTPGPELPVPVHLGRDVQGAMFDLSADGRFVVASRGKRTGHIWVMEKESGSF